jgi:hypothetical protein
MSTSTATIETTILESPPVLSEVLQQYAGPPPAETGLSPMEAELLDRRQEFERQLGELAVQTDAASPHFTRTARWSQQADANAKRKY